MVCYWDIFCRVDNLDYLIFGEGDVIFVCVVGFLGKIEDYCCDEGMVLCRFVRV